MKKNIPILILIFLLYAISSWAEPLNLLRGGFPVELYKQTTNNPDKESHEKNKLEGVGRLYIDFDINTIDFEGLRIENNADSPIQFSFTQGRFDIKKVIKIDEQNYAFEGFRTDTFKRKISGIIKTEKIDKNEKSFFGIGSVKVLDFQMTEVGIIEKEIRYSYRILNSAKGESIINKFKSIDFGNYNIFIIQ